MCFDAFVSSFQWLLRGIGNAKWTKNVFTPKGSIESGDVVGLFHDVGFVVGQFVGVSSGGGCGFVVTYIPFNIHVCGHTYIHVTHM